MAKNKKAPKGRAAAKQKAKKGGGGGAGAGAGAGGGHPSPAARFARQQQIWNDDDDDDDFAPSFRGFSQSNNSTPSRNPKFSSPRQPFQPFQPFVKLRHQTITFVSGGTNTPIEFQPKPQEELEVGGESEQEHDEEVFDPEEDEDDGALDESIQTNIVVDDVDVEMSKNAMADMDINGGAGQKREQREIDVHMADSNPRHAPQSVPDAPAESLFVVDTMGDESLAGGWKSNGKRPVRRSVSPSGSDSSEEVVIFHGRQPQSKSRLSTSGSQTTPASFTPSHTPPIRSSSRNEKVPIPTVGKQEPGSTSHVTPQQPTSREHSRGTSPSASASDSYKSSNVRFEGWATLPTEAEYKPNAKWAPAPAGSWWKKGRKRPDLDMPASEISSIENTPRSKAKVAFAEPRAEETIRTLQADWKAVLKEKQAAKKTTSIEEDVIALDSRPSSSKRRGKRGRKLDNRTLRKPVIEDDDDDDGGEAAYDDYMENLAAQLDDFDGGNDVRNHFGQSSLLSEPSLYVDGQEIADDEVLTKNHFDLMNDDDDSDSDEIIGQDYSEMDSSELEDELDYTQQEQWEDEEDLRERRREQMTDEQIARMFAKQQEFGYDGDDLILENGDMEYSSSDQANGVGDVATARAGLADFTNQPRITNRNGVRRSTRRGQGRDTFPDASALADSVDQYGDNGFDIMDFNRPSLRATKRGRKGALPPEIEALSDDELRETLAESWSMDRRKKSLKKAEREAQRAEGWLTPSGKKGKNDLSVKYAFGISMEQVHSELRAFLLDEGQTSRAFPPMGKKDRKDLHEVANVLNLKSKSVGAGNSRFPTLYKTGRTPYSPDMVDRALELSMKGLLSRDKKLGHRMKAKNAATLKGRAGQGGGAAAASVRNGEVVGAGAKEIGVESKGHKLMLKMGWAQGMALGKDGEGRLLPVEQRVRLGTVGLG